MPSQLASSFLCKIWRANCCCCTRMGTCRFKDVGSSHEANTKKSKFLNQVGFWPPIASHSDSVHSEMPIKAHKSTKLVQAIISIMTSAVATVCISDTKVGVTQEFAGPQKRLSFTRSVQVGAEKTKIVLVCHATAPNDDDSNLEVLIMDTSDLGSVRSVVDVLSFSV